ncbi:MAG: UbiA family prenyltransferase [Elusimicrobiota bacterium]
MTERNNKSKQKVLNLLNNFVSSIEQIKMEFGGWVMALIIIVLIRNFLESAFMPPYYIGFSRDMGRAIIRFFVHYSIYYINLFLVVSILTTLFTGERIQKVFKVILTFLFLTWLPPLIDFFIVKKGVAIYYPFTIESAVEFLVHCFNPFFEYTYVSAGQRIEIFLAALGLGIYFYLKKRNILSFFTGFVTMTISIIILTASLPVFFAEFFEQSFEKIFQIQALSLFDTNDQAITIIFLFQNIFFLGIFYYLYSKKKFKAVIGSLQVYPIMHYILLCGTGFIFSVILLGDKYPTAFSNPTDYLILPGMLLGLFFVLMSAGAVNKIFSYKNTRDLLKPHFSDKDIKNHGIIFFTLGMLFGICISPAVLVIFSFFFFMNYIYFAPPLRLKRFFPFNILVITVNSFTAFLLGYSALPKLKALIDMPGKLALLIFISYFMGVNIIYIKNLKSDRNSGIYTLPTILGKKWSKRVIAALSIVAFFSIPYILNINQLYPVSFIFGILSVFLILRKKWQENFYFINYFVYFIIVSKWIIDNIEKISF